MITRNEVFFYCTLVLCGSLVFAGFAYDSGLLGLSFGLACVAVMMFVCLLLTYLDVDLFTKKD